MAIIGARALAKPVVRGPTWPPSAHPMAKIPLTKNHDCTTLLTLKANKPVKSRWLAQLPRCKITSESLPSAPIAKHGETASDEATTAAAAAAAA